MAARGLATWTGTVAGSVAVAGWLAGCAAPQSEGSPAAVQAGAAALAVPAAAPPSAWGRALAAKGCALPGLVLDDRLEHLQRELEPLGLEPRLQGCTGEPPRALLLDAWVTDGRKAVAVVRGPLADGEPLDLGLPVAGSVAAPDGDVSPDVQFNRNWWQGRLRAYGLQPVPGQVRAFVPAP